MTTGYVPMNALCLQGFNKLKRLTRKIKLDIRLAQSNKEAI